MKTQITGKNVRFAGIVLNAVKISSKLKNVKFGFWSLHGSNSLLAERPQAGDFHHCAYFLNLELIYRLELSCLLFNDVEFLLLFHLLEQTHGAFLINFIRLFLIYFKFVILILSFICI